MKKATISNEILIDPVCLMKITADQKDFRYTYKMRTYYFCAEPCRKAFELSPDKYLEQKLPKSKGWWGRYLDRLNKATGGEPPKCH